MAGDFNIDHRRAHRLFTPKSCSACQVKTPTFYRYMKVLDKTLTSTVDYVFANVELQQTQISKPPVFTDHATIRARAPIRPGGRIPLRIISKKAE